MTPRALAFLRELSQRGYAKFHTPDPVCDAALFRAFPQVSSADSTGLSLPASLREAFPGTGRSPSPAGATLQLVGEYKRRTLAHFALGPGKLPDSK